MFLQCSYNVRTMFVQCSYNVQKKFVQCPTKVRTIFYKLFGHCTNIVRTLCAQHPATQCSMVHQKMPADKPKHLTVILLFSGCTLDNEIVPFVLTLLWPAARARLSMRDLTCMLYTVPKTQSYRWVYQAMQVRPWQPGFFDIIWQQKPVTTYCRAKARFHRFPSTIICIWILG